jgi:MFS family permease
MQAVLDEPTPRQASTPRQARVAIGLFFLVSGFGFATWASRIPTIQHQLGLTEAGLGGVLLAMPAGLMLTLPLTGVLMQRFSSRQVMVVGAVLYNLVLTLLGQATHTWQLVALLFCFGASRSFLNIAMNVQSMGVQARYGRSIVASFHGVWSVAGFAAAAVGTLLVGQSVAPGPHFAAVAAVLTVVALLSYRHSLVMPSAPGSPARKPGFAWPEKALLSFGLIAFASMACEGTMYDWSSIYFEKALLLPKTSATLGFATYMVAMTIGRFSGDWLANRFGVRPVLRYSGMLIGVGLLLAALAPLPLVVGVGFVLVGLGVSCVVPMTFALAGQKTLSSGAAVAGVSTIGYFGFLIVPPLIGFIAEAASLRWSFGLMALFGGLIVWLVRRMEAAE